MFKNTVLLCLLLVMTSSLAFSAEMPSWLEGWNFKGDLRLRYEGIKFDNNRDNRSRGRFRLRLGADKKLSDKLAFGLRLASGGQATSTNETFDASFSGKDIFIDKAYLTYKVGKWDLGAGKVTNPYESTDLVWDTDVNPEGAYARYKTGGFAFILGGFVVEESSSSNDLNLIAPQLIYQTGESIGFTGSLAYYVYDGFEDEGLNLSGNNFDFFDALLSVKFKNSPLPVSISADYTQNTQSDFESEDTGYGFFLTVGNGKKPGEWQALLKYGHIEKFSVFGLFADSDFGFSDSEGFKLAVNYQSSKFMNWGVSLFDTDTILAVDEGSSRVQLDCAIKF